MKEEFKEIIFNVSQTNDLQTLIDIWNGIAENKYKYSLTEIEFANQLIRNKALKSNGSDIDIGKFYNELKQQVL